MRKIVFVKNFIDTYIKYKKKQFESYLFIKKENMEIIL